MNSKNNAAILGLISVLVCSFASASYIDDQPEIDVASHSKTRMELEIDWSKVGESPASGATANRYAVTSDTIVTVSSKKFNFVAYSIDYEIETEVIEAYKALDAIWQELFGLTGVAQAIFTGDSDSLVDRVDSWGISLILIRDTLDAARSSYVTLTLSDAQISQLATDANDISNLLDAARTERTTLRNDVVDERRRLLAERGNMTAGEYEEAVGEYEKARDLLDEYSTSFDALTKSGKAFIVAADLSVNGDSYLIGKKEAGTIVTFSATPKPRDGSPGGKQTAAQIVYAVSSNLPLVFHAGAVHSDLGDFEFEEVTTLAGQDLFAQTKSSGTTTELTAFLSYPVWSKKNDDRFGALISLGTDFDNAGDNLYVGITLKLYSRFFLTFGQVSGEVEEGLTPIQEEIANQTDTRELFAAVDSDREWETFVGISFAIWEF